MAAVLLMVSTVGPAYADLGNCTTLEQASLFQGSFETDVVSTTGGTVARVMVRDPDLCTMVPPEPGSGSSVYIMLTNQGISPGVWYQIQYVKQQNWSCPHWYMQYRSKDRTKPLVWDYSTFCASSGTWYTLVLRHIYYNPGWSWQSYVLTSNNCCYVWQAPNDPASLDWSPQTASTPQR
jgi:hypothetical protein